MPAEEPTSPGRAIPEFAPESDRSARSQSRQSSTHQGPTAEHETRVPNLWGAKIDAACDDFEQQWLAGKRPDLGEYLRGWEGEARAELFKQLLALELDYLQRAKALPKVSAYTTIFPEFTRQIAQCYSAMHRSAGAQPASAPLRLGEYELLEKIGEGGMGTVFKARHRRMDRVVAIKILSPKVIGTPTAIERFQREVKTLSRLSHPNIVTAFDAGEDQGMHYLAMEYVAGQDLSSMLRERGPLPMKEALRYILQAAEGLEYAHRQGVIHRDIKPGNLLVDEAGKVRILDLGLARSNELAESVSRELTESQQMLGTVDYMSPEQAASSKGVDLRTDIYSLGCTLYRLLTNRCLYEGETAIERIFAHREEAIPNLHDHRDDVPATIEELYQRMVAKRPDDRPASLTEVIEVLRPALLVTATTPVKWSRPRPTKLSRTRVLASIVGSALALVTLLASVSYFWNRPKTIAEKPAANPSSPTTSNSPATNSAKSAKSPPIAEYPLTTEEAQRSQQAWADYLKVPLVVKSSLGQELILIPPGKFTPGSTAAQIEAAIADGAKEELDSLYIEYIRAEADFRLKQIPTAFYLAKTEVTIAHFRQFVEAKKYLTTAETNGIGGYDFSQRKQVPEANWKNPGLSQGDDHPVVEITVADALAFCEWLSQQDGHTYFLPTETQWEYACRAGTESSWFFGNDPEKLTDYAWYEGNSERTTHPVGLKLPNAFGLYDMSGNVREWTSSPAENAESNIIRGGAFLKPPVLLRSAMRVAFKVATPYPYHGFRIARELK